MHPAALPVPPLPLSHLERPDDSEPLHVYIGASTEGAVAAAKELVENLVGTVRFKYQQFW